MSLNKENSKTKTSWKIVIALPLLGTNLYTSIITGLFRGGISWERKVRKWIAHPLRNETLCRPSASQPVITPSSRPRNKEPIQSSKKASTWRWYGLHVGSAENFVKTATEFLPCLSLLAPTWLRVWATGRVVEPFSDRASIVNNLSLSSLPLLSFHPVFLYTIFVQNADSHIRKDRKIKGSCY
jgi:hypothetical protein